MKTINKIIAWWRNAKPGTKIGLALVALFVSLSLLISDLSKKEEVTAEAITYSEFLTKVDEGAIAKVVMRSNSIEAKDSDGNEFVLHHERWLFGDTLPKDLAAAGVEVGFPEPTGRTTIEVIGMVGGLAMQLVLILFFGLIGFVLLKSMRGGQTSGSWPEVITDNTIKFDDVAGQEESKFELAEIKEFLTDPASFEVTGAKPPRGVLMVGPAGTGKTLLARALAGEAGVNFIAVTGSDFSNMFVGVGRNRVEKLFKKARKSAPCIVFIDEIDSVGRKRGAGSSDVGREQDTTLNQLLTEMNGFKPRDGVVVIAATNRIDVLDPALIRPGRFDRHVHVNHSDMDGRRAILEVHAKGKPVAEEVDFTVVARGTPGFSGADLENLVNEAAILAARQRKSQIEPSHFEEARDKVLMGLQRNSMVLDENEKKLIAVHEAGHAVIACLTPGSDPVHQATIVPRGRSLGLVMRLPERDRISIPKSKLLADLDVLMAGRAAEEIVFGPDNVTTGASSDIEQATSIARRMVSEWGMSDAIGMVRAIDDTGKNQTGVEVEVRAIIDAAYKRAKEGLNANRAILDRMTAALLDRQSLNGDEVRHLAGGNQF